MSPSELKEFQLRHYEQRLKEAKAKGLSAWKEVKFIKETIQSLKTESHGSNIIRIEHHSFSVRRPRL